MELRSILFSERRRFKEVVGWAQIGPIFPLSPMLLCNGIFFIVPIFHRECRNFRNSVIFIPYKFSLLGKIYRNRIEIIGIL